MYDQTSQSTLAETLIAKQAPEGRTSNFQPGQKIDFRFPTSGGYVDSFASSTLDFDLDISAGATAGKAYMDPYLGAHGLIDRIVVTVGGNIIEDTTNYPLVYKAMKALHGNIGRENIDLVLSEDVSAFEQSANRYGNFYGWWGTDKTSAQNDNITINKTRRYPVRLNLLSCLGSLSGSKYWPSALLDSDIRLEIYLNQKFQGMALGNDTMSWQLNNVEFTTTRVRLNTRVIESLKSSAQSGGVKMIMPGFSHFQETVTTAAAGGQVAHNLKYSSSASSLKSILLMFRLAAAQNVANKSSYQLVDPLGLEYQFLIGSTLMPARPIFDIHDKYRELMRCVGGPVNSLGQRNLISKVNYMLPLHDAVPSTSAPAAHMIGQSLEMYADHTLSSQVFSGINAINLTMQCQLKIASVAASIANLETAYDQRTPENLVSRIGETSGNAAATLYADSILVFDRLLNFNGSEVTMSY